MKVRFSHSTISFNSNIIRMQQEHKAQILRQMDENGLCKDKKDIILSQIQERLLIYTILSSNLFGQFTILSSNLFGQFIESMPSQCSITSQSTDNSLP